MKLLLAMCLLCIADCATCEPYPACHKTVVCEYKDGGCVGE